METMQRKRIEKYQPVVEDVERNHRHSLYHELTLRTPHIGTALSYQGNEISYTEMLQAIDKTADALSAMVSSTRLATGLPRITMFAS